MSRTPIRERTLPLYSKGEEITNMVTHIVGAVFGIVACVLTVVASALRSNVWGVVGCSIYGFSIIALYTISSVYHGLHPSSAKKVMQVLDHCTIYLLIAGTYTPILLSAIRPGHPVVCWVMFGAVWGLSALAITLNAIDLKQFKVFSMICYIALGWAIVSAIRVTYEALTAHGFILLLLGGIAYTVGSILYGVGKKVPYMHSLFHIFVVAGSVLHFAVIFCYAI